MKIRNWIFGIGSTIVALGSHGAFALALGQKITLDPGRFLCEARGEDEYVRQNWNHLIYKQEIEGIHFLQSDALLRRTCSRALKNIQSHQEPIVGEITEITEERYRSVQLKIDQPGLTRIFLHGNNWETD